MRRRERRKRRRRRDREREAGKSLWLRKGVERGEGGSYIEAQVVSSTLTDSSIAGADGQLRGSAARERASKDRYRQTREGKRERER